MESLKDKNILIVDDEIDICSTLSMFFKTYKANVFEAYNSKSAFEIIKNNSIDFVITDVKMPGGDGVELLDNIKKYNSHVPIVLMVTGFADISKEEAIKRGAVDLLSKPVDYDILVSYVKNILENN